MMRIVVHRPEKFGPYHEVFLAKSQDSCCGGMDKALKDAYRFHRKGKPTLSLLSFYYVYGEIRAYFVLASPLDPVSFCPWCGEPIEFAFDVEML